jgi:hypothetical protein
VVLVGDRRPEERHDPVARVLVHRAFEAVHALGEDLEEAIEYLVPLLGIEPLGELHRALHVGEQDGDLLALAFEGRLRLEDLLGEVLRRVVARAAFGKQGTDLAAHRLLERLTAAIAEARSCPELAPAPGARARQRRPAAVAEASVVTVRAVASGAVHGSEHSTPD